MTKHFGTNVLFTVALLCLIFLGFYHPVSVGWYFLLTGLYLFTAAIGSYFIELNFFTHSYCRGSSDKAQIAITFDDGPNSHTERILDSLKAEKAPATFFCIGINIKCNEAILSRIDKEGHLIGNHSFEHKTTFPLQSAKRIATEIRECSSAIESVIHKRPLLFRAPFGVTDPMIAGGIKLSGVQSVGWSLRSYDTVVSSPDKLLQKTQKIKNGDIILFHDAGLQTDAVLSQFIRNARKKGFEIIPLDQLLGIAAYDK